MQEQKYKIIILNQTCFDILDNIYGPKNLLTFSIKRFHSFTVGDMLAIRDDLTDHGMMWGQDFYASKVPTHP